MPWVMMVLSSATTGRPAASAAATGAAMSMKGRAVSASCQAPWRFGGLMPPLAAPAQGPALRPARGRKSRRRPSGSRWSARRRRCLRAAPARNGMPCIMRGDRRAGQRIAGAGDVGHRSRGAGGTIEKMPPASKPVTAPLPAVITPRAQARRAQPPASSPVRGFLRRRRQARRLAPVHEQAARRWPSMPREPHHLGRRDGDGEDRLAAGERRQPLERRRPAGWRRTARRRRRRPPRAPSLRRSCLAKASS